MAVGGVRGGGGKGKAGGVPGSSGGVGGAGRTFSVDKSGGSEKLVGPSGAAGSSNVETVANTAGAAGAAGAANVQATEPLSAQALAIAQMLRQGHIGSKGEASRRFVAEILKEKLRMQSKALTDKIAQALEDDPRLNAALERLWSKE